MKITKENYDYYKKMLVIIWQYEFEIIGLDIEAKYSPVKILSNLEAENETMARKCLKEGIMDSIVMIKDWPNENILKLDKILNEQKLPSVKVLMSKIRNIPKKVMDRGKIKNINEYYIIKEVLDDVEYEITPEERIVLNKLFREFEINYKKEL